MKTETRQTISWYRVRVRVHVQVQLVRNVK